MECNPVADPALRQALLQLTSTTLQPRLAGELIARTVASLVQPTAAQPAQAVVHAPTSPVPTDGGSGIDLVV